ncbi:hypothetical protein SKAU_G00375280 [Synaphobranchus kaupii]|uniref:Uncharacterized protein n=1 Tax=Synaphobranchus kaupii TaxID=118154 RepID=A0A9Q1EGV3_SYNKA|nr:hypothetical protein SKAU_G00375280 [Synaphobranchus kaupii]
MRASVTKPAVRVKHVGVEAREPLVPVSEPHDATPRPGRHNGDRGRTKRGFIASCNNGAIERSWDEDFRALVVTHNVNDAVEEGVLSGGV